jgi:hypothetical protein
MATTCRLIAKNVLGSDAASVEFTSIPATYDDLLCVVSARLSVNDVWDYLKIQPNSASTNFTYRILYTHGSVASSVAYSDWIYMWAPAATATSSTFGITSIYIPNYSGSTNKSMSIEVATENNSTTSLIAAGAGLWSSTSAISSLLFTPASGNVLSGSSFYLHGITKA